MKYSNSLLFGALMLGSLTVQAGDCALTATLTVTEPTCGENNNGGFYIHATGGLQPYTYYVDGVSVPSPDVTGLIAGWHAYWVNDAANCWFKSEITLECKENCQFRTQTMGGWGAPVKGNNPAKYLRDHWTSCFANGVTIGCASVNTLTLTTSNAVMDFLPSGSTAGVLTHDWVNPGGSLSNVLAGQLVAATISMTLDGCVGDFSPATSWLGDATYTDGPFVGMSVSAVIDAANLYIGGCGGSHTAAEFNHALTDLNENYDNGTADNGHITCGKKGDEKSLVVSSAMRVYPNPANDLLTVSAAFNSIGQGNIQVSDLTGRVVLEQPVNVQATGMRAINLDVNKLKSGVYLVTLQFNGSTTTDRIVVSK